jgi:hypothetical protein
MYKITTRKLGFHKVNKQYALFYKENLVGQYGSRETALEKLVKLMAKELSCK